MLDFIKNLATFLSLFYVKFWLCSTNVTDAPPQLDLDLLKLREEAKTKVGDSGMIKMVEIGHVKLKNHLWYLSERFVPLALFSARVADRDKKEMVNAILKYQNHAVLNTNKCLKQKILGPNYSNILRSGLMNL